MPHTCPNCGAESDKPILLCGRCGLNTFTGDFIKKDEEPDPGPPEPIPLQRRLLIWFAEYLPGFFRPLILLGAIVLGAVGLGIIAVGMILLFAFMVIFESWIAIIVGSLAWAQAVAFMIAGEFEFLPDALVDFDQTKWALFWLGLVSPGVTLMIYIKYFADIQGG